MPRDVLTRGPSQRQRLPMCVRPTRPPKVQHNPVLPASFGRAKDGVLQTGRCRWNAKRMSHNSPTPRPFPQPTFERAQRCVRDF